MASFVLQPEAASAVVVLPHFFASPRRSAATKTYQVLSMNKFQQKRPFSARILAAGSHSHRSRSLLVCKSSGSSAKAATSTSSRPAAVFASHNDQSRIHFFDSVLDAPTVISGYWIGPDMDDGCGNVVATLQRIV